MRKYFIDITFYSCKNNLEKMLDEEFRKIEHCTVMSYNIKKEIDTRYNNVVTRYRNNKGRGKAEIRSSSAHDNHINYKIGENIRLYLIPIKEEL